MVSFFLILFNTNFIYLNIPQVTVTCKGVLKIYLINVECRHCGNVNEWLERGTPIDCSSAVTKMTGTILLIRVCCLRTWIASFSLEKKVYIFRVFLISIWRPRSRYLFYCRHQFIWSRILNYICIRVFAGRGKKSLSRPFGALVHSSYLSLFSLRYFFFSFIIIFAKNNMPLNFYFHFDPWWNNC